jgi:transcriptional regulator with XRE-family HTH domain
MPSRRNTLKLREIFGLNVRLERTRQGMTQEELGALAAVDQAYVSKIELAAISTSVDVVEALSKALKVPPGSLFDESLGRK